MATPLSLHSITLTKIHELEKLRTKYETRKKSVLEFAGKAGDGQRERINRLRVEHKELLPEARDCGFRNNVAC